MTKLSIATALLLGVAVFAQADDLATAFSTGKVSGDIRVNSIDTDWKDNNGYNWNSNNTHTPNKPAGDSRGTAVGGNLDYVTGSFYGLSAGAGFYTTQSLGAFTSDPASSTHGEKATTGSDLFARGPGAATSWDSGYSVLAESYLKYSIVKSTLTGGRFLMTNPWISPNNTKMIPLAVEGASFVSKDIPNTIIQFDFADKVKERGMSYFGNMADTGDTPDAIKNYYRTHYTPVAPGLYGSGGQAPGVFVVGATNKSINALELQAWFMNWQDIVNQGRIEANYALPVGDAIISFGARYMQQWDTGAGNIILPATGSTSYGALVASSTSTAGTSGTAVEKKGGGNNNIGTDLTAVRVAVTYGPAKLMAAYSHTDSGGDILAPWRGFPTDGYTRSMTQTDWNANTKAYKIQLDYDLKQLTQGLSASVSNSFYDRDPSKLPYQACTDRYYNNGDTHQWNFDAIYKVPYIKNLELKARYMIQKNQVLASATATPSQGFNNDTSNNELRLEANYRF